MITWSVGLAHTMSSVVSTLMQAAKKPRVPAICLLCAAGLHVQGCVARSFRSASDGARCKKST